MSRARLKQESDTQNFVISKSFYSSTKLPDFLVRHISMIRAFTKKKKKNTIAYFIDSVGTSTFQNSKRTKCSCIVL